MTFSEYQTKSRDTAIYPDKGSNMTYPTLGLAGETGEVCEKLKKYMRDGTPFFELQNNLKKELGDVLWYVAQLATEARLNLDDIANANIDKLQSRKKRGKLQGSGDDR